MVTRVAGATAMCCRCNLTTDARWSRCSDPALEDVVANALHEILHEAQVVCREEDRGKRFLGLVKVVEVGARVGQIRRDRLEVLGPLAVSDLNRFRESKQAPMPAVARRKRRVKGVDAVRDAALDGGEVCDAEEMSGTIRWELRGHEADDVDELVAQLAKRPPNTVRAFGIRAL